MAYRGYLIKQAFAAGLFFISKDGHHISTAYTLPAAQAIVDELLAVAA